MKTSEKMKEKAKEFQERKIKVGYEFGVAVCMTDGFVLGYRECEQDNTIVMNELYSTIQNWVDRLDSFEVSFNQSSMIGDDMKKYVEYLKSKTIK